LHDDPDIFVVDDEPSIANTTSEILRLNGFSSVAFINPHDALIAVNRACPKLLIVDLKMPGLSGLDLAIQTRARCPNCELIFFTGHPGPSEATETHFKFSMLYKPASPADLILAVSRIMDDL
jgi:DNA-binding NtrC family response regulator